MPDLLVRDLDPLIDQELRRRARREGRSLSAVAQALMRRGLLEPQGERGLGSAIRDMLPADCRVDLDIPRHDPAERPPPDFA